MFHRFLVFLFLLQLNFENIVSSDRLLFNKALVFPKDRDVDLDTPQLIEDRGFQSETHYVTTADGYVLTVHRIINRASKSGRPFILQHGVAASSRDLIINSPGLGDEYSNTYFKNKRVSNNLGFAMAMFGYDVWMPNSRGNLYSKNHTKLNPKLPQFWEFTIEEIVKFDLPAIIEYVLSETKRKTLGYIGHSQGTRIMFCLLSERPEFENIIKPFVALAPVARVNNVRTPYKLAAVFPIPDVLSLYRSQLPNSPGFINFLGKNLCRITLIEESICINLISLGSGYNFRQVNQSRLHVILSTYPAGTSTWNIVQYAQNYRSQSMAKFDYGILKNLVIYKSPFPPVYNLMKIKTRDICLMSSMNDFLAPPDDVQWLREQLPDHQLCDHIIPQANWDHFDFIYALQQAKYVNVYVLKKIATYDDLP